VELERVLDLRDVGTAAVGPRTWCGNMDCDGPRNRLLYDVDGSLLGGSGSSVISLPDIPFSPKAVGTIPPFAMFVDNSGRVMSESYVIPNGYGGFNPPTSAMCTRRDGRGTFSCPLSGGGASRFHQLVIESLDADWKSRRISPVALNTGGHSELLRGTDAGARAAHVGTFHANVAAGRGYEIYFR
jgi:hypothetical protein